MPQQVTYSNANILGASPLTSARAVFSRPAGGGDPELVFAGMGSGIAVLTPDPGTDEPVLYAGTSGAPADSRLDVGGVVRDIVVFENRIFVAADRQGLVVFERQLDGTWNDPTPFRFRLPDDGPNDAIRAFALVAWRHGGDLRVLVGTADYQGHALNGRLFLLAPDAATVKLAEVTGLPGVWSLAAFDDEDPQDPKTVVLVGTACGGVRRYHFPVDATAIPVPVAVNPLGSSRIVRGLAIHRVPGVETIAFAALDRAANADGLGVAALDLAGNGVALVSSVVPQLASTVAPDFTYSKAIAVDSDAARVVVGLGDYFATEKHYAHPADEPIPCSGSANAPTAWGVIVYRWEGGGLTKEAEYTEPAPPLQKAIASYGIALRPRTSSEYVIDIAGQGVGMRSLQASLGPQGWDLTASGAFDQEDKVILNSPNEVLVQERNLAGGQVQRTLYASGELCVATWDVSGANPDLREPHALKIVEPANALTGYPGPNAKLFCSGFAGTTVFSVTNPLEPVQFQGVHRRKGRGFGLRATPAIPAAQSGTTGQDLYWVVEVNYGDDGTTEPAGRELPSGGLHVYAVTDAVWPTPTDLVEVASWMHRGQGPNGALPNADLRDIDFLGDVWYVSTSPREATLDSGGGVKYPADDSLTLLVLRLLHPPEHPGIALQLVDKIQVVEATVDDVAFRVTVDPARGLVYVALGKQGFAVFDISADPLAPALLGVRAPAPDAEPIECYECRPGPGDKLVVTSLDRGLWVIDDASSPSAGSDSYLRTRSQAIGLANDPGDPSRLFVADGGSGVFHVQL